MKRQCVYIGLIALLLSGGCAQKKSISQDEMFTQSAAVKKLSAAVESAVQYKNAPKTLENNDLLLFSTAHNPKLLSGFEMYVIKAKNVNAHSLVLLCSADGSHAFIEDSGCTGAIDIQHWQKTPLPPCEFTIKVEDICDK